ncbi:MAG: hypothetical protein AB1638_07865 [Nitrospirota bacterium]
MAKDEFIGIRVSKEFKKFIQRESKRKGMSLSEYIEKHSEDNFKNTKKHIQDLVERAKEDRPAFWEEADKCKITKEFEQCVPEIVSDILHPLGGNPKAHPVLLLGSIPSIFQRTIVNLDSVDDGVKMMAIRHFLSTGEKLAENLNKLKSNDKDEQAYIISEIKKIIETFAFYFTSMAFAKDAFVKIKNELDKTEKTLLNDINKKTR